MEEKKINNKAVDLDVVSTLVDRLDQLERKNKELQGALEANNIVDPNLKKELGDPEIKISLLGGKIVKSWKTLTNISYVMGNKYICDQTMEVTFYDGSKTTMSYQDFNKNMVKEVVRSKRIISEGGRRIYVFDYNGNEYELSDLFIN